MSHPMSGATSGPWARPASLWRRATPLSGRLTRERASNPRVDVLRVAGLLQHLVRPTHFSLGALALERLDEEGVVAEPPGDVGQGRAEVDLGFARGMGQRNEDVNAVNAVIPGSPDNA